MHLTLPPRINANGLLPFLTDLGRPVNTSTVTVDFTHLRRVSPAALAALACQVARWRAERRTVIFHGLDECPITGYLQRMDVLTVCGIEMSELFTRHDGKGRFVPVQRVEQPVEQKGDAMASCVAPDGDGYGHPLSDLYDFVWYVMTETANNVRQHSGGVGFMTAQVTQAGGFVKLAVADNGRGIRQSFIDAGLPWAVGLDDVAAIRRALEPKISSKGSPSNEGVGLTLSAGLARLAKAWMLIVSGRGVIQMLPDGRQVAAELPSPGFYQGTLVALSFKQTEISDFPQLLTAAKIRAGLLPSTGVRGTFET